MKRHARRLVRFRHHARTVLRGSHAPKPIRPTSIWKARTSIAAGSIRACSPAAAIDGRAPYKALLTHGFVVDGKGMKMSKSKGNVVAPQKVSDTLGAEILRLWVASTDYSGELSISEKILQARGRGLSPHAQHPALPARQHRRLRSGAARCCRRPNGWNRPLRAGPDPAAAGAVHADYERFELPQGGPGADELLLRGPGRLLPRHPQGPPLHRRAENFDARAARRRARCGTSCRP
jgi:hypothetical protein